MQISTPICTKQLRKTRRGWLGYKVKQIHLRDDIPCGLEFCTQHANQSLAFRHDPNLQPLTTGLSQNSTIYILDSETLVEQADIVYNCEQMRNIVFLQSAVQKLRKGSLSKFGVFKSWLEAEAVGERDGQQDGMEEEGEGHKKRNYWLFADNYHKTISETNKNKLQLLGLSTDQQKQWLNLQNCAQWYQHHINTLKLHYKIVILTTNEKYIKQGKTEHGLLIKSLVEFLKEKNSGLLDFIGFRELEEGEMAQQAIWEEHLQVKQAQKLIKSGKLFQGKYMSQKSYIKIGKALYKIKLQNNRALFGDVIAVEIAPFEQWEKRTAKAMITEEEDREPGTKVEQEANEEVQVGEGMKNLVKMLETNASLLPKGRVRSILRRNIKDYCGSALTNNIIKTSQSGWKMFQFKPADERFPTFYIRTYNVTAIDGKRIQVAFDSWPSQSKYPLCHFLRVIGNIGDLRTEGNVILLEHNVEIREFSRKAYECLPKQGANFVIPKTQEQYRLDLRHLDVCSIDPPGCKDIDDALHCIRLPNGNLQIGVHIADVSYYVRPDTALDLEARNRCTTVYLVDRRTDMLPKLLTETLCSLRADSDKLAFSTIWEIDDNANIKSTKYCKTIIRSRRAFTYMQAQQLMDSDSTSSLAISIRNLNKIAKKLKQKRLDNGALTLASTKTKISLEEETHSATDVQIYEMVEANYLIEQFMLLANIAVAQKIYSRFPSISILRRHTSPKIGQLQVLRQILSLYKYDLNYQNSKALADSLTKIDKVGDPFFNRLIRILTTRCMNEATYFCSADFDPQEFYHYGLAAPFYTHFTSPIRRYADILVHRLLAAAIDLEPLPNFMINKIKMSKVCDKMNLRNRMARYASSASSDYHTYQFFKQKKDKKYSGVITSICETTLTIMLIKYGLECKYELSPKDRELTIQMNKGHGVFTECRVKERTRKLFEYVDLGLEVEMHGFHKKISIDIL